MKIFSLRNIFIVAGAILVIVIIVFSAGSDKETKYTTQPVVRADLVQTVSATGKIKSASEVELNFKNPGEISVLKVAEGDQVRRGQILAQIRGTALAIDVDRARADLKEAEANLNKIVAGATPQEIAVTQAQVAQAITSLENAQDDLANTEKTYQQELTNERLAILNDINSALTKARISLQHVNDTLNYEGNDDYFQTTNSGLELTAENDLEKMTATINSVELDYVRADGTKNDADIDLASGNTLTALKNLESLLEDMTTLLEAVIVTQILTQAELDTLKTDTNTERTTTDTSITTIQTAVKDLADARLNLEIKVKDAQNSIAAAEKSLAKAEADLNLKLVPSRPEDVARYQAIVDRTKTNLRLAQDKFQETILTAAINGVITEVNYRLGEQTSATVPVIKMRAEHDFQIEVDIPESDVAKISLGDQVEITFDAFTDDDVFIGAVVAANLAETEIQDVIYYRLDVRFLADQPENVVDKTELIRTGMTVNITIETERKADVLLIPSRAVKQKNGNRYVEVLDGSIVTEIPISLGTRGDGGVIEVTAGLLEGQEVITFTKTDG